MKFARLYLLVKDKHFLKTETKGKDKCYYPEASGLIEGNALHDEKQENGLPINPERFASILR